MKRLVVLLMFVLCLPMCLLAEKKPKYVFFFIGDGMGPRQVQCGEWALKAISQDKTKQLSFTNFPVKGFVSTHSADNPITDSAAGGTALATGSKTNNGVIAQTPDGKKLESITDVAQRQGWQVGVISTSNLNDATPAVFYSHAKNRSHVNSILKQFADKNIQFLFGKNPKTELVPFNHLNYLKEKGLVVVDNNLAEFRKLTPSKSSIYAQFDIDYEVARNAKMDEKIPTLAEMTQKGIDLMDPTKGFFMMVEGGRIDHACHENNFPKMVYEVVAFSDAIQVALNFMEKYPEETLIVITADHETGGVGVKPEFCDADMKVCCDKNATKENLKKALQNVTWETTGHTAKDVPIFAKGVQAERFSGKQDNVDVAKKLKEVIASGK